MDVKWIGNENFRRLDEMQQKLVLVGLSEAITFGQGLVKETEIIFETRVIERAVELALCQAATRFDPQSGIKFSTFSCYFIKGTLIAAVAFGPELFSASPNKDLSNFKPPPPNHFIPAPPQSDSTPEALDVVTLPAVSVSSI